jgi:hypothetical protein
MMAAADPGQEGVSRVLKAVLIAASMAVAMPCFAIVHAQEDEQNQTAHRHHPAQDQLLHEKFYSTWHMPDNPAFSCCNNADCYPTEKLRPTFQLPQ